MNITNHRPVQVGCQSPPLWCRQAVSLKLAVSGKFALLCWIVRRTQTESVAQQVPPFMPCHKLPNYLKTYRKRAGFSQDEIALLLGCKSAGHVSRYERFHRLPSFHTLLAFKVIFQASARELFTGEYQTVEDAVSRQAQRLATRLATENPDPATVRKLALLRIIAALPTAAELS
jgi:transcriptional regulator with XRE-family HTH domain